MHGLVPHGATSVPVLVNFWGALILVVRKQINGSLTVRYVCLLRFSKNFKHILTIIHDKGPY